MRISYKTKTIIPDKLTFIVTVDRFKEIREMDEKNNEYKFSIRFK